MKYIPKPLPYKPDAVKGISERTMTVHYEKLYKGYVNRRNEVEEKLSVLEKSDLEASNQVYSFVRGLGEGETFAANGMILHEMFFDVLDGDGRSDGTEVRKAIEERFGSWEAFISVVAAKSMAARGWAILAFDPSDRALHIYTADSQNQGGVWGCTPLMGVDVYEHAYVVDYGADRKTYVSAVLAAINWKKVDERYKKAAAAA
jgi:superoxide dismutase, Fe-Mn family